MGEFAPIMTGTAIGAEGPIPSIKWEGVNLQPQPARTRLVLRGSDEVCAVVAQVIGLALPSALRATSNDARHLLWQGPDEYLILAEAAERQALFARLAAALEGRPHALVDVSQRDLGLMVTGERVELLLASAIMLDLYVSSFPVGMTTRTLFGKADVTLWRQAPDQFYMETGRSFAPYVVALLHEGARGM